MKILFVCTSNKDRSPALQDYFTRNHSKHQYKSAGVNNYFTHKHDTHYLEHEDIQWADLIVYAETVHKEITEKNFLFLKDKKQICLNLGEFNKETAEDYLTKAEFALKEFINP